MKTRNSVIAKQWKGSLIIIIIYYLVSNIGSRVHSNELWIREVLRLPNQ